jgi:hypothetical protein
VLEDEVMTAYRPIDPARRPRLAAALGAGALLLALAAAAAPALAQERRPLREADLRCLTNNPDHCLDQPMPRDEPHQARCATCHNLRTQPTLADAAQSCTGAGCHVKAELSPFHEGLRTVTLDNCIGCHPAHDVRIVGGAANCAFCHTSGGARAGAELPKRTEPAGRVADPHARRPMDPGARPAAAVPAPTPAREPISLKAPFTHREHNRIACADCHPAGKTHGVIGPTRIQDCRACHHTETRVSECQSCHTRAETSFVRSVTRTMQIRIGRLDRPLRQLPFDHARHVAADCKTCHLDQGQARRTARANCSSCHEQHHQADRNCMACHRTPAAAVHSRDAHLGCGGVGCHENALPAIQQAPRTRTLCLACHTNQVEHEPAMNCADCHRLPAPRPGASAARLSRR